VKKILNKEVQIHDRRVESLQWICEQSRRGGWEGGGGEGGSRGGRGGVSSMCIEVQVQSMAVIFRLGEFMFGAFTFWGGRYGLARGHGLGFGSQRFARQD
jgi:hypothetical protein